jgi:hypothetical protein
MDDDDIACAAREVATFGEEDAANMSSRRSSKLANKDGDNKERLRQQRLAPARRLPWARINHNLVTPLQQLRTLGLSQWGFLSAVS